LTTQEREQRRNRVFLNLILDVFMVVIILTMTLSNKDAALECDTPIFMWLLVFDGICILRVIKNLMMIGIL
jgi:hypothetical protein